MSLAKFSGALAAFVAKQNPDIAYQAADNAIENNAMLTGMLEGEEALALAAYIREYSDALAKDVSKAISEATEFLKEASADALEACADYLKANPDNPEIATDMLIGIGIANGGNDNSGILKKGVGKNQAKRQMLITAFKAAPKHMSSAIQKVRGAKPTTNKGPYNPREMQSLLEKNHGAGSVSSSTLPQANQKNVKLAGTRHPETGIVFDQRGFPIFDDVTVFDTRISRDLASVRNPISHMQSATLNLKKLIEANKVNRSLFTEKQLQDIMLGKAKIHNLTWHHHQEIGRMQLIPTSIHKKAGHIGGNSMWPTTKQQD